MNNQHARRAFLGGDFKLVSPSAVVGHRPAFEHLVVELRRIPWIGHCRVIDQHYQDLAAHVHTLVIIPSVLGRHDPVTDKDHVCVEARLLVYPHGAGDEVSAELELKILVGDLDLHLGVLSRGDAHERDFLKVSAVAVARRESHLFELIGDVGNRKVLAVSARASALVQVRGESLDVRHDACGGYKIESGFRRPERRRFRRRTPLSRAR